MMLLIYIAAFVFSISGLLLFILLKILTGQSAVQSDVLNFSVVIAAKNEEKNIPDLINSLKNIDYPRDKFEVIIADDNSSDKTFETANRLITGLPNFSIINCGEKKYPGKKGALAKGIENAENQLILITDADCRPEPGWIKSFAGKFTEGYDFLIGAAPFYSGKSLAELTACFENLRNSFLIFAAVKIGLPYSAMARSFGFRRQSFVKLGGYGGTLETLSGDDDLLLREAVKKDMRIGVVTGKDSFVFSKAKNSFGEYFVQKSRHIKTSFYYLPSRQLLLGGWHLLNLLMLFSPMLFFISSLFPVLFLIKILIDSALVLSKQKDFGYKFSLIRIIYLQILYEIFLIVNFIGAKFKKEKWK